MLRIRAFDLVKPRAKRRNGARLTFEKGFILKKKKIRRNEVRVVDDFMEFEGGVSYFILFVLVFFDKFLGSLKTFTVEGGVTFMVSPDS